MEIFKKKDNKKTPKAPSPLKETIRHIGKDAYVDWAIIFVLSVILAAGLVTVGTLSYFKVENSLNAPPTAVAANSLPNLDAKLLDRVILQFDNRATERAALPKRPVAAPDPSL